MEMNHTTETQETTTVECHNCFDEFEITVKEWDRTPVKRFYCSSGCIYADLL